MKKVLIKIFLLFLLSGCAFSLIGSGLETKPVKKSDIEGTFTVILYGANHMNDLKTIAILDREGDEYEFEPYAPEFEYRVKKNLTSKDAITEAEKFVSWHHSFNRIWLSKIIDPKGRTIGYEVRPLYYPWDFGFSDVLDIDYFIDGKKVFIRINLIDAVERQLSGEDRGGILFD